MEPGAVGGFALAALLIELTPGPNMAWLAVVAASTGRWAGTAAVAGVSLGLAVVGGLAALGLGAAIAAAPFFYEVLRWAGVGWLLWLSVDGWRAADEPPEAVPVGWGLVRYFRRGLITNLLNPKAALFYIAVLPGFVEETAPILPQTLTLSAIYVAVASAVHLVIVLLAGVAARILVSPTRARAVRRALAVALALVALWFAWETA